MCAYFSEEVPQFIVSTQEFIKSKHHCLQLGLIPSPEQKEWQGKSWTEIAGASTRDRKRNKCTKVFGAGQWKGRPEGTGRRRWFTVPSPLSARYPESSLPSLSSLSRCHSPCPQAPHSFENQFMLKYSWLTEVSLHLSPSCLK